MRMHGAARSTPSRAQQLPSSQQCETDAPAANPATRLRMARYRNKNRRAPGRHLIRYGHARGMSGFHVYISQVKTQDINAREKGPWANDAIICYTYVVCACTHHVYTRAPHVRACALQTNVMKPWVSITKDLMRRTLSKNMATFTKIAEFIKSSV